jgi:hypothetical protein
MQLKYYKYPKNFKFWQGEQPDWGTVAAFIDGAKNLGKTRKNNEGEEVEGMMMAIDCEQQDTRASIRRKRRKRKHGNKGSNEKTRRR